jgi:hypothetical protein
MAQYIFDRALTVAANFVNGNTKKEIAAGSLAFFADQISEPSLNLTLETEEVRDARNNLVAVLDNGRSATFGAANAFFNTSILATQAGTQVKKAAATDKITRYEVVDITSGAGVVSYTPATPATAKVYALNSDGSYKEATPITGATLAATKAVSGVTEGITKVLVEYETLVVGDSNEKIVAYADAENELLSVTAEILLKDLCSQATYLAILKMRGKISGEVDWSMARDGNHPFEITALPDYCGGRQLVEIIIVKDNEMNPPADAGDGE